jgi:hypothetical protein
VTNEQCVVFGYPGASQTAICDVTDFPQEVAALAQIINGRFYSIRIIE